MGDLYHPPVVLDCGTGYTKLGFAGNSQVTRAHTSYPSTVSDHDHLTQPSFVIPTAVGFPAQHGTIQQNFATCAASTSGGMRYCVGEEAVLGASHLDVVSPLKAGLVGGEAHPLISPSGSINQPHVT